MGRRGEIREEDLLRRKERTRSGRKEKDGGSISRGYLSHSLSYTKFPSGAVILETVSKRLCTDGDEAMVTHTAVFVRKPRRSLMGFGVTFQCKLNIFHGLLLDLRCRHVFMAAEERERERGRKKSKQAGKRK